MQRYGIVDVRLHQECQLCHHFTLEFDAACTPAHLEALLAREAIDLRWQEVLVLTRVPPVACRPGRSRACAAMPRSRPLPAVHCAGDGAATANLLLRLLQLLHLLYWLLLLLLLLPEPLLQRMRLSTA
jgi:hypothetical protein